jgi:hypothetical protein
MSTPDFIFSDPSPTPVTPAPKEKKKRNAGGRPKSLVWETHAIRGAKVSEGHYEATCAYCKFFWKKGSPQDLEAHFANECSEVPADVRQLFLNRLVAKAEENGTSLEKITAKKRKLNNGASVQTTQTKISEFHESTKLSEDRIHEIDRACVKAFVVCGIAWHVIENPFFIEFLKTLRPGYVPPSKEVLSGKLLSEETAVVNTRVTGILKNTTNLTLCMYYYVKCYLCYLFEYLIKNQSSNLFSYIIIKRVMDGQI